MKRNEWAAWRLPLVLAVLLAAASVVLFWYSRSWAQREEAALAQASQALAALMAQPMPERLDAESLSRARAALPPTPEVPQLMQTFRQSAEAAGVTWVEFQADQTDAHAQEVQITGQGQHAGKAPETVTLNVTLRGTYMEVYRLFQEIGLWPRLVDAPDWDLIISPAETTARLRLAAYYLPRETEQEPGPVETDPPGGRIDPTGP